MNAIPNVLQGFRLGRWTEKESSNNYKDFMETKRRPNWSAACGEKINCWIGRLVDCP